LAAAQEAVGHYRQLARAEPDRYRPDVGRSDLVTVTATDTPRTRRAAGGTTGAPDPNVVSMNELRPLRARDD
jgi:hypothetical protein